MILLDLIIILVTFSLGLPVFMFVLECFLGLRRQTASDVDDDIVIAPDAITTVLIPAHNEALLIRKTLDNVKQQLLPRDNIVVVADNCDDETAAIAQAAGCTVLERQSEDKRGKGYALAYGVGYLARQAQSPTIVVVVDADCMLEEEALSHLKAAVARSGRPVQACYLMKRGPVERMALKISEFAFMVKNRVRLLGLERLRMPVPLTGTGMAFPWQAIAGANLATGDIVEDMRLGVELAEAGLGATYCDKAQVYSFFPVSEAAEHTQRERWEHGHLSTLIRFVPRLFKRALSQPSLSAFGMMMDLMIPPLSLLVMIVGGVTLVTFLLAISGLGQWSYMIVNALYLCAILFAVTGAWLVHGRSVLSAGEVLHIPIYVVSKLAIYVSYLVRKQTKWIRTERK